LKKTEDPIKSQTLLVRKLSERKNSSSNNNRDHRSNSIVKFKERKQNRSGTHAYTDPSFIKSVFNITRKIVEIKRPPENTLIPLKKLYIMKMENIDFVKNFNFSYENEKIKSKSKINEFHYEKNNTNTINVTNINNNRDFNDINNNINNINDDNKSNNLFNNYKGNIFNNSNNKSNQFNFNFTANSFKPKPNYFEEKVISKPRKSINIPKIELFNSIRENEKQQMNLEKKLSKIKKQEDAFNKFTINEGNDFSTNIIKCMQHYIDMKREDDILKYDYITKIDNGLVFKETLKENIMHKLIPGTYMYQNKPLKFEVFHPKFVKTKFCMGMIQTAGKPIVKGSDHSLKEYSNYYNKRRDQVVEKNAFSIMNII
jgi:hypothetical protein